MKRNLTFHAWRHFFNTLLRMNNIADSKVQKVTGHKTKKMMELYTHFDTKQFTEVRDVQTNLLACNQPETKIIADEEIKVTIAEDVAVKLKTSKKKKTNGIKPR